MINSILRATGAILVATAATSALACEKAAGPPVIHLAVYSPLTMAEVGPATDVAIDAAGCVTSRFNAIDKRHGVHRFQLGGSEFAALKREIQAAKLLGFDPTRVKAAAASAPASRGGEEVRWHVSDPDIVELTLAPGIADAKSARGKSIRFANIDGMLMNRPDLAELHALSAVKSRLAELGSDARLKKEAEQ